MVISAPPAVLQAGGRRPRREADLVHVYVDAVRALVGYRSSKYTHRERAPARNSVRHSSVRAVRRYGQMLHHLTSGELALAASAITAAASAVVALAVSRAGRRGDHVARLWEHRAEVYEFVLCHADWWRETRVDAVWKVGHEDLTVVTPPEPVLEDPEWRKSWARLEMYGERSVREAFERYGDADKKFVIAFIDWRKAAEPNSKAGQGDVSAQHAVDGSELVRLRKAVEAAHDKAAARARASQSACRTKNRKHRKAVGTSARMSGNSSRAPGAGGGSLMTAIRKPAAVNAPAIACSGRVQKVIGALWPPNVHSSVRLRVSK